MDLIEMVSTLALLATIGVMIWQNVIARRASQSANVMELVKFLQEEDNREARDIVYRICRDVDLDTLMADPQQVWAATKVCTTYDVTGLLLRTGFARRSIFLDGWSASIIDCYRILEPFIRLRREQINPAFWHDFSWLYQQTNHYLDRG